jgi:hypothetical protein
VAFQGVEPVRPLDPELLKPGIKLLQRLPAEAVEPSLRVLSNLHETYVTEHLEMPGDAGLVHPDNLDQVPDRAFGGADSF